MRTEEFYLIPNLNKQRFSNTCSDCIRATIENQVCEYLQLERRQLYSISAARNNVFARGLCCMLLLNFTNTTLGSLGEIYNRHHTTVINSCKTIAGFLNGKADTPEKQRIQQFLQQYNYATIGTGLPESL